MRGKKKPNNVVIYQAKSGAVELRGDLTHETVWATQYQIASAFDVDVRTVNEHLKNIYKTKELSEKSTIRNFRIVQKEGKRDIERNVKHYNLDAIISVGYRVNSKKATTFRQWATKTLRSYVVDGFVMNKKQIAKQYKRFNEAIDAVRRILPKESTVDRESVLELVSLFADTWLSLDAYDKDALPGKGVTRKSVAMSAEKLLKSISDLKAALIKKGEATDLFASEREKGSITGIVGNVLQSFGGQPVYATIEEQAAHLLYFMVKNHPFLDGNKRSGAYAFVWYLRQAKILDTARLTPTALTAITILVAESDPAHKDKTIKLILSLI